MRPHRTTIGIAIAAISWIALAEYAHSQKDTITAFRPAQGPVCSKVVITGKIYAGSSLVVPDGVMFGSIAAQAQISHEYTGFVPPNKPNPLEIVAIIPPHAVTGSLAVSVLSPPGLLTPVGQREVHRVFPTFVVTGSPAEPGLTFSASPTEIEPGSPVSLSWTISGTATKLVLSQEEPHLTIPPTNPPEAFVPIKDLQPTSGSDVEHPSASIVYGLTAYNSCISTRTATARVTVFPPLDLSLGESAITLYPTQSATVPVTIPADLFDVKVVCATNPRLSCSPLTIPAGATSGSLTVTANSTTSASTQVINLGVTATDAAPVVLSSTKFLKVTIPAVALTLNPSTLLLSPLQTGSVAATVTPSPFSFTLSCAANASVTCNDPTINAGSVSATLAVTATSSAAPGTTINPLVVTATGVETAASDLKVEIARTSGPFALINPDSSIAVGAAPAGADGGACTVQVKPKSSGDPSYEQYDAIFTCGAQHVDLPFAIGGPFGLGGVGFSSNQRLGVVISDTAGNTNEAAHVHFIAIQLSRLAVHAESAYDKFNAGYGAGISTPVPPQIFASPDATLILVTSLNPVPSASTAYVANVYDLNSTSLNSIGSYTYPSSASPTAVVNAASSGSQTITISAPGLTAKTFPIP